MTPPAAPDAPRATPAAPVSTPTPAGPAPAGPTPPPTPAGPTPATPLGVGLDAVDVERFRRVVARRPGLVERVFTAGERADLAGRADPVPGLAARFAAKEAAMKALGVGLGAVDLAELEVRREPTGAPRLLLTGRAASRAAALGVAALELSLTHTDQLAAAVVLAR